MPLKFNVAMLKWHWNVNNIKLMGVTDFLSDLMKGKLNRLRHECRLVLQIANKQPVLDLLLKRRALEMLFKFLAEAGHEHDVFNINDILDTV
jgi:predicted ATPase